MLSKSLKALLTLFATSSAFTSWRFPPKDLSAAGIHKTKWDDLDFDKIESIPVAPDMRYIPRNTQRQFHNFLSIREAAGSELTKDVYVRDPIEDTTFWFVGKIAHISDTSPEDAIRRQASLIRHHASNLRPLELFASRNSLEIEIYMAPGDSEMDVAYNRPSVRFEKVELWDKDEILTESKRISNKHVGYQGEMYQDGEPGFRTWRKPDGTPLNPEIEVPTEKRAPNDDEMKIISEKIKDKDLMQMFEKEEE